MKTGGEKLLAWLKDCLFPVYCVDCGAEGEWWCGQCRKNCDFTGVFSCPVCHTDNTDGAVCLKCRENSRLDGTVALCRYDEGAPVGKIIKIFKYGFVSDIALVLGVILNEEKAKKLFADNFSNFAVMPVPLHPRRERTRGFNQARVIAEIICAGLPVRLAGDGLKRVRHTPQQARLSKEERAKNLSGAFAWILADPPPERILLVDDVFTTGATMQECARVLKSAGAKTVWGFTLARG